MGVVLQLPSGKARKAALEKSRSAEHQPASAKTDVAATVKPAGLLTRWSKAVAKSIAAATVGVIVAPLAMLYGPIKAFASIAAIAMFGIVVYQGLHHWPDPKLSMQCGIGAFSAICAIAAIHGLIVKLRTIEYRLQERSDAL